MTEPTGDRFVVWTPREDGVEGAVVGPEGVETLSMHFGGERPEVDQGLLLDDGSLYGPGTRRQAMAAAADLDESVDWKVSWYHQLKKVATRVAGPLPDLAP